MESLLHYVWQYKLFNSDYLTTTAGESVEIVSPGKLNRDAGPDFFNAQVKIGGRLWAGNVEMHTDAADWFTHGHDKDRAYDSVILHVVEYGEATILRSNGEEIPQLVLPIPFAVRENISYLLQRSSLVPCGNFLSDIDPIHLSLWKDVLLVERLERKRKDISVLLERSGNDWNEVFYVLLCRNFGFGTNSDAFERLARSLPWRCVLKQRYSSTQTEALFFGQAGLLEEDYPNDRYYCFLKEEYRFFRHKYDLTPLDDSLLKSMRMRPGCFPHLRLAQLAQFWVQHDSLFSTLIETVDMDALKRLFQVSPSDYWETHYHLGHASSPKKKPLGLSSINLLLINTVAPLLFAYGEEKQDQCFCDRAIELFESLPPENNYIVRAFARHGVSVSHAGDSQALIQLMRAYCEPKKCLYCRVGFRLLKKSYTTDWRFR